MNRRIIGISKNRVNLILNFSDFTPNFHEVTVGAYFTEVFESNYSGIFPEYVLSSHGAHSVQGEKNSFFLSFFLF